MAERTGPGGQTGSRSGPSLFSDCFSTWQTRTTRRIINLNVCLFVLSVSFSYITNTFFVATLEDLTCHNTPDTTQGRRECRNSTMRRYRMRQYSMFSIFYFVSLLLTLFFIGNYYTVRCTQHRDNDMGMTTQQHATTHLPRYIQHDNFKLT